jgi:hypothetical protein
MKNSNFFRSSVGHETFVGRKTSPRESSKPKVVFISPPCVVQEDKRNPIIKLGLLLWLFHFFPAAKAAADGRPEKEARTENLFAFGNESEETAACEGENRNRIMLFMPIQGKVNYSRPERLEINKLFLLRLSSL